MIRLIFLGLAGWAASRIIEENSAPPVVRKVRSATQPARAAASRAASSVKRAAASAGRARKPASKAR